MIALVCVDFWKYFNICKCRQTLLKDFGRIKKDKTISYRLLTLLYPLPKDVRYVRFVKTFATFAWELHRPLQNAYILDHYKMQNRFEHVPLSGCPYV